MSKLVLIVEDDPKSMTLTNDLLQNIRLRDRAGG